MVRKVAASLVQSLADIPDDKVVDAPGQTAVGSVEVVVLGEVVREVPQRVLVVLAVSVLAVSVVAVHLQAGETATVDLLDEVAYIPHTAQNDVCSPRMQ